MRRPDDSDDALALSTSFDKRPPMTRRLQLEDPLVSLETVRAADGVQLSLKRYLPRRLLARNPVILCHGLAGNSTAFDLDLHRDRSLAWMLAAQHGHPVYMVNLRGAGDSDRPASGWTLDDLIHRDVPALIDYVRRANGDAARVHWVGHSLGGIVGLCAMAAATPPLQPYVQTITTLGSALEYEESVWKRFAPLVPVVRLIPHGDKIVVPEALAPALLAILQVYPSFLCADRITPQMRAMLERSFEPVSLGVMLHLATAIEPGGLAVDPPAALAAVSATTPKGQVSSPRAAPAGADAIPVPPRSSDPQAPHRQRYLELLGRVKTPVLAICGDRDVHCGEAAVLRMMGALGSVRRRFVMVGSRGEGGTPSYGHMDLLLKDSAAVDVFGYVCDWIAAAEAGGWGPDEFGHDDVVEELKVVVNSAGGVRRGASRWEKNDWLEIR